jgi:hypothetical protein
MAIRKRNTRQQKLSTEQVQDARFRYFRNTEPARQLAWEYGVSENLMRDAIHGKRGYANIPDPEKLTPEDKDPKARANLKSKWRTDYRSQQRRLDRQWKKNELERIKNGGLMPKTLEINLPSPSNIDWKDEERKARVAQNKHWKKGWD